MKIQKFTFPLFFFPPWFWKISVPPRISLSPKILDFWWTKSVYKVNHVKHHSSSFVWTQSPLCLKFICSCSTCKLWFWFWNVTLTTHFSSFRLIKEHPKIVLPVANNITQRISSFIRNIDFALDWMQLESGKSLYRLVWQRKTI